MVFCFYLGDINYKILYPILLGITSTCIYVIKQYINKSTPEEYGIHNFFYYWFMFLTESTASICFLIKQLCFPVKIYEITKKNINQTKFKFYCIHIMYYLLFAILDLVSAILFEMTEYFFSLITNNCFNAFQIIILIFLCKVILHYKYYKHHGVGLGLQLLGLVILSLSDLSNKHERLTYNTFLFVIFSLLSNFLSSLQECLEKYVMDTLFFDPFMLVSGEGICGAIIVSILFPFLKNITCAENKYHICIEKGMPVEDFAWVIKYLVNHLEYLTYFSLLFVLLIAFNCLKMITNQNFTPLHRYIGKDIRSGLLLIIKLFFVKDYQISNIVLSGLSFLFIFFGDLTFLEIIILNFCDLKSNTKPEILKREKIDTDFKAILDNDSFSSLTEEIKELH